MPFTADLPPENHAGANTEPTSDRGTRFPLPAARVSREAFVVGRNGHTTEEERSPAPTPEPRRGPAEAQGEALLLGDGPVLVHHDGTAGGRAAVGYAASVYARRPLLIACLWTPVTPPSNLGIHPSQTADLLRATSEAHRAARERALAIARKGVAIAQELGAEAHPLAPMVQRGKQSAEALTEVARLRRAGQLVLPAAPRRAVLRRFGVTAVERLAANPPCPVVIVPAHL
jgi:nucleotide-binding universal stress UspA family protein